METIMYTKIILISGFLLLVTTALYVELMTAQGTGAVRSVRFNVVTIDVMRIVIVVKVGNVIALAIAKGEDNRRCLRFLYK